jgi:hypothetical protein
MLAYWRWMLISRLKNAPSNPAVNTAARAYGPYRRRVRANRRRGWALNDVAHVRDPV